MVDWLRAESLRGDSVLVTGVSRLVAGQQQPRVQAKPHREAAQRLAVECARLARENSRLRGVIREAANLQGDSGTRETRGEQCTTIIMVTIMVTITSPTTGQAPC